MGRFSKLFLAHAGATGFDTLPDLEARLAELWREAQGAWPRIELEPGVFLRHLAERMPARDKPEEALAGCAAGNLYLACACMHGDPIALAEFERAFLSHIGPYVAHLDSSQPFAEEIKQHLRSRLLVASEESAPKIADYAGRGSLAGWLRVAAVWSARDLQRRQRQSVTLGDNAAAAEAQGEGSDPEMDYMKRRYGAEFKQAFGETLASLPPREQNILNLYFVDGTTLAAIGTIYKVHESTVARWVARCRETILKETRRRLGERLQLETGEFESLMGLVQSRLDLSISRYFKLRERK